MSASKRKGTAFESLIVAELAKVWPDEARANYLTVRSLQGISGTRPEPTGPVFPQARAEDQCPICDSHVLACTCPKGEA